MSASCRIRPARESDDDFFVDMGVLAARLSLTPSESAAIDDAALREATLATDAALLNQPGMEVFIADCEGKRAGVLWVGTRLNPLTNVREGWIYSITVAPEFQGFGVGRELMQFAEDWARQHGFDSIGLMVSSYNERARKIYAARGYEDVTLLLRKSL